MVRNKGKLYVVGERNEADAKVDTKGKLEDEVDVLFRLPLAEFTGARNTLSARLKKSVRADEKAEAARVKALAKPPISAWAVNQLYWNHREAFDRLIASGERFHKSQRSGKMVDMRTALDARREALTDLTDLATSLLRDAGPNPGQNPSLDIIRRITTTLEAMSAYASRSDAPPPGRLTHDVDPPGFDSLASFVPAASKQEAGGRRQAAGASWSDIPGPTTRPTRSPKSDSGAESARQKQDKYQGEVARKAKIAAAKVSLQDAKRSLTQARAWAQRLEPVQKKADAEAKKAEKHKRDAEQSLEKAKAALEVSARRARKVAVEIEEAASAVDDAESAVEKASKELESLSRESSGR